MMKRLPFSRLISTVLLAVLLLGSAPAQASAEQRIIVRTGGLLSGLTVVQSACKLLGCKVLYGLDGSLGKLFLDADNAQDATEQSEDDRHVECVRHGDEEQLPQ
jgi:hypothetical protein